MGGYNAALLVGIKEENKMLNGVTIIAGDEVRVGSAQIMHNDMGEEILMIKTEKRRALYPACKQTAEEAAPKQTKVVKRISKPKAIKKSEVAEELTPTPKTPMLQVKSKNRRAGRSVICLDNNIKFNSMIEAAKTLFPEKKYAHSRISGCCRGITETAYGLRFKYAD